MNKYHFIHCSISFQPYSPACPVSWNCRLLSVISRFDISTSGSVWPKYIDYFDRDWLLSVYEVLTAQLSGFGLIRPSAPAHTASRICLFACTRRHKDHIIIICLIMSVGLIVGLIVNSGFLERPRKRSRGNQLIHRRLTKTKSIGSGQNPESQAGRQSDG